MIWADLWRAYSIEPKKSEDTTVNEETATE